MHQIFSNRPLKYLELLSEDKVWKLSIAQSVCNAHTQMNPFALIANFHRKMSHNGKHRGSSPNVHSASRASPTQRCMLIIC